MKTIKTSELSGKALDYAVALAEGFKEHAAASIIIMECYAPSSNWSQGGPIIDREILKGLQIGRKTTGALSFCCYAEYQGAMWEQLRKHYGNTSLVAAMRCYVASKLGDSVEVPDELL